MLRKSDRAGSPEPTEVARERLQALLAQITEGVVSATPEQLASIEPALQEVATNLSTEHRAAKPAPESARADTRDIASVRGILEKAWVDCFSEVNFAPEREDPMAQISRAEQKFSAVLKEQGLNYTKSNGYEFWTIGPLSNSNYLVFCIPAALNTMDPLFGKFFNDKRGIDAEKRATTTRGAVSPSADLGGTFYTDVIEKGVVSIPSGK